MLVEELQECVVRNSYEKDKLRFRCGKESRFPQTALKLALYDERDGEYESALYNLLEARAAVMTQSGKLIWGKDRAILEAISKVSARVKAKLPDKYFVKGIMTSRLPLWIFAVLDQYKAIRVKLKKVENDHYKLIISNADSRDNSKAIVVVPPLERAAVVSELRSDVIVHTDPANEVDGVEFIANCINVGEDNSIEFLLEGETIMTISDAVFFIMEQDL